jgi:hypothetical protein
MMLPQKLQRRLMVTDRLPRSRDPVGLALAKLSIISPMVAD